MRTLALLVFLFLGPANSAEASSLSISCDPRVELLGIIQRLSLPEQNAPEGWEALKTHPAVALYRETIEKNNGRDPYGLILLALSDPPSLVWKRKPQAISGDFVAAAGGREKLEEFLAALRDFAAAGRFMEHHGSQKPLQDALVSEVRRGLGSRDHMKALEAYTGVDLETRMRVIVSPVYQPNYYVSYIFPYPYGGAGIMVKGPYEVFTLAGPEDTPGGLKPETIWNEPLYILVERGYARHEAGVRAYQSLHARAGKDCPGSAWPTCAKHILIKALDGRFSENLMGTQISWEETPLGRMEALLSSRLREYESDRKRYPSLLDFYPRWVAAFGELEAEFNKAPAGPL